MDGGAPGGGSRERAALEKNETGRFTFSCLSKRKWTEREGHQRGECFVSFPSLDSPLSATKERAAAPSLETPRRRSPRRGDQKGEPRTPPCGEAKNRSGLRCSSGFSTAAENAVSLFPPPAAGDRISSFVASRMGVPGEGKTKSLPPGVLSLFPIFSLHGQRENGRFPLAFRTCTKAGHPHRPARRFPRRGKQGRAGVPMTQTSIPARCPSFPFIPQSKLLIPHCFQTLISRSSKN